MKKGSELVGTVKEVRFPNKAIIETEEGIVSAKNALPGDKVRVRVLKMRKGNPEAMVLEVLEKSEKVEKRKPSVLTILAELDGFWFWGLYWK